MSTATKAPPTDTGRCGEQAGWQRHVTRREQPCDPCREARNEYQRRYRAARQVPPDVRGAKPLLEWLPFGKQAGRDGWHEFVPLDHSQCFVCFGWRDDPRHPVVGGPVVGR